MQIRPLEQADVSPTKELLRILAPPNDPEGFIAKWLGGWPHEMDRGVVATDDGGEILGACCYRMLDGPRAAPEVIIVVRPEDQGRGVGRLLLRENIAQAKSAGHWAITAVINPSNLGAKDLLDYFEFHLVRGPPDALHYVLMLDPEVHTSF